MCRARTNLEVHHFRKLADLTGPDAGRSPLGFISWRCDGRAIAQLELVGTLREPDASLDDIRQLLAEDTTLRDLATAHLGIAEREMRRLQARRPLLRTVLNNTARPNR